MKIKYFVYRYFISGRILYTMETFANVRLIIKEWGRFLGVWEGFIKGL